MGGGLSKEIRKIEEEEIYAEEDTDQNFLGVEVVRAKTSKVEKKKEEEVPIVPIQKETEREVAEVKTVTFRNIANEELCDGEGGECKVTLTFEEVENVHEIVLKMEMNEEETAALNKFLTHLSTGNRFFKKITLKARRGDTIAPFIPNRELFKKLRGIAQGFAKYDHMCYQLSLDFLLYPLSLVPAEVVQEKKGISAGKQVRNKRRNHGDNIALRILLLAHSINLRIRSLVFEGCETNRERSAYHNNEKQPYKPRQKDEHPLTDEEIEACAISGGAIFSTFRETLFFRLHSQDKDPDDTSNANPNYTVGLRAMVLFDGPKTYNAAQLVGDRLTFSHFNEWSEKGITQVRQWVGETLEEVEKSVKTVETRQGSRPQYEIVFVFTRMYSFNEEPRDFYFEAKLVDTLNKYKSAITYEKAAVSFGLEEMEILRVDDWVMEKITELFAALGLTFTGNVYNWIPKKTDTGSDRFLTFKKL